MDKSSLIKALKLQGIQSQTVLETIEKVPRGAFVAQHHQAEAYENYPLPIGPSTDHLAALYCGANDRNFAFRRKYQKYFRNSTGSGYQAAILSQLVEKVYTVERILPLLEQAREKFKLLKYTNIYTHFGDGYLGWSAHAPYDAIIVTAATPEVPVALLEQLADPGRLLLPLGPHWGGQQLQLIIKTGKTYHTEIFEPVVFVPMLTGTSKK